MIGNLVLGDLLGPDQILLEHDLMRGILSISTFRLGQLGGIYIPGFGGLVLRDVYAGLLVWRQS